MPRAEPRRDNARQDLRGAQVVITRPREQAQALVERVRRAGGRALRFALLEIGPPADVSAARGELSQLAGYDVVLFVSANAVECALRMLGGPRAWPAGPWVGAVGAATAAALRRHGIEPAGVPEARYDSESLLATPLLAPQSVRGSRVLIVRGEGGREVLAEALRARGAEVRYAEVYRRMPPSSDPKTLLELLAGGEPCFVVLTSGEAFANLRGLLNGRERALLRAVVWVAVSERVAEQVRASGLGRTVVVAERAGDDALVEAMCGWIHGKQDGRDPGRTSCSVS